MNLYKTEHNVGFLKHFKNEGKIRISPLQSDNGHCEARIFDGTLSKLSFKISFQDISNVVFYQDYLDSNNYYYRITNEKNMHQYDLYHIDLHSMHKRLVATRGYYFTDQYYVCSFKNEQQRYLEFFGTVNGKLISRLEMKNNNSILDLKNEAILSTLASSEKELEISCFSILEGNFKWHLSLFNSKGWFTSLIRFSDNEKYILLNYKEELFIVDKLSGELKDKISDVYVCAKEFSDKVYFTDRYLAFYEYDLLTEEKQFICQVKRYREVDEYDQVHYIQKYGNSLFFILGFNRKSIIRIDLNERVSELFFNYHRFHYKRGYRKGAQKGIHNFFVLNDFIYVFNTANMLDVFEIEGKYLSA